MTQICKYEVCTGCGACFAVCPVSAISMSEDGYRGLKPVIDQDVCVDCNSCREVCPSLNPVKMDYPLKAFAAYSSSAECRSSSASGGVASVLAETVISKGGVVYGCVMESGCRILHERIDTLKDVKRIKGSKYVQSLTADSFSLVKADLDSGRTVLFTGTPCQVAGLKNYAAKVRGSLITVDLCCHGVPSQSCLKEHITGLNYNPTECHVFFRRKDRGQIRYGLGLIDKNNRKSMWRPAYRDSYMTGFLSGIIFRESCFTCPYASAGRCGDITLADFWGNHQSDDSQMTVGKGLSAVLVNTENGMSLLESSMPQLVCEERSLTETLRSNTQFFHPSVRPEKYDGFMTLCDSKGWKEACSAYMPELKRKILFEQIRSGYYKSPFRQALRRLLKKNK